MRSASSEAEPSSVGEADDRVLSFERLLLPHLGAAYNLARWITRNEQDAEDLVQEAYLRALKSFGGFRGGDGRSWLLAIVRNTCSSWLKHNSSHELTTPFNEDVHNPEEEASNPETVLLRSSEGELIKKVLQELTLEFREVLIMRELEGLSYKEIATVAGIPIGTVMSRLARARRQLSRCATRHLSLEAAR